MADKARNKEKAPCKMGMTAALDSDGHRKSILPSDDMVDTNDASTNVDCATDSDQKGCVAKQTDQLTSLLCIIMMSLRVVWIGMGKGKKRGKEGNIIKHFDVPENLK